MFIQTNDVQPNRIELGKGVIVLTYGCNMKCSFCYAAAEVFDKPATMPIAEAKRSIDFLSNLGVKTVTLLGGEPTFYKHLHEVVEYGLEKGVSGWIVTNGTRFATGDYAPRLIEAGIKGGCISLHGHTPAEHDSATRMIGSFETAIEAVKRSVNKGWPFYPMITVMERNLASVLQLVNMLRDLGCGTIYINYGLPGISDKYNVGGDATPEALAKLSEELFLMQDELGVRFLFNREKNKIPLCHFNHDILKNMFDDHAIGSGCEAVQGNTIVIEPGGSALGCSHWVEHPLLNIYDNYDTLQLRSVDEFWDVWMNGEPAAYRDSLSYFPYEQCEGCGWRLDGKCFGGCKVWQEAGNLPKLKKLTVHAHKSFDFLSTYDGASS